MSIRVQFVTTGDFAFAFETAKDFHRSFGGGECRRRVAGGNLCPPQIYLHRGDAQVIVAIVG